VEPLILDPVTARRLASIVLSLHVAAALLIVFGLAAIPLGAARGWAFVHGFGFRSLHLAAVSVVALQKVFGQTCFLSVWEERLLAQAGREMYHVPVIHAWADDAIHIPLPMSFLIGLYVLMFAYTVWLWWKIPVRRSTATFGGGREDRR
jgi:uncharacterized protein DUF2784